MGVHGDAAAGGVAGHDGLAVAIDGADAGARAVLQDPIVVFKCLSCDLKEGEYKLSYTIIHKISCRKIQANRQQREQERAAQRLKKAAARGRNTKKKR